MPELKRVLGLKTLIFIVIGQIIGSGIFISTCAAMSATGPSVFVSYIIAFVLAMVIIIPYAVVGAAMPMTGMDYRAPARTYSTLVPFVAMFAFLILGLGFILPMYGIACASYLSALIPGLPIILTAILILSLYFLMNIFGVRIAANIGITLTLIMLVALFVFVFGGIGHIDMANMTPMFPEGAGGLISGAFILYFAVAGGTVIANLGGEIKNPKRNLPWAIIIGTVVVTIVYAFVAFVAAGVMPWQQSLEAGILTPAAASFLPEPLLIFFAIGGGFLAISTTMIASLMWMTKPWLMMAEDNVIPKWFAAVNNRFKTPHRLLIVFWIASVAFIVIMSQISLAVMAMMASVMAFGAVFPMLIAGLLFPSKFPKTFKKGPIKMSPRVFQGACLVALGIALAGTIRILMMTPLIGPAMTVVAFAVGVGYYIARKKYMANQGIKIGPEPIGDEEYAAKVYK